jgi:hypothetical protein
VGKRSAGRQAKLIDSILYIIGKMGPFLFVFAGGWLWGYGFSQNMVLKENKKSLEKTGEIDVLLEKARKLAAEWEAELRKKNASGD